MRKPGSIPSRSSRNCLKHFAVHRYAICPSVSSSWIHGTRTAGLMDQGILLRKHWDFCNGIPMKIDGDIRDNYNRAYQCLSYNQTGCWDPSTGTWWGQELPIVLGSHKFACETTDDLLLTSFDSLFLNATWACDSATPGHLMGGGAFKPWP